MHHFHSAFHIAHIVWHFAIGTRCGEVICTPHLLWNIVKYRPQRNIFLHAFPHHMIVISHSHLYYYLWKIVKYTKKCFSPSNPTSHNYTLWKIHFTPYFATCQREIAWTAKKILQIDFLLLLQLNLETLSHSVWRFDIISIILTIIIFFISTIIT